MVLIKLLPQVYMFQFTAGMLFILKVVYMLVILERGLIDALKQILLILMMKKHYPFLEKSNQKHMTMLIKYKEETQM